MSKIEISHTDDEQELKDKQAELIRLKTRLTKLELDLATLQAQLHAFEVRYIRSVGVLYSELDEINAQIAEELARIHPDRVEVQNQAQEARAHARETAETVGEVRKKPEEKDAFQPSDEIKQLYRKLAKQIHPDLASDDDDRSQRNDIMAEVNRAYEDGNIERLQQILHEWKTSPEAIKGETIEARLARIVLKIERVRQRLTAIRLEMESLTQSRLHELKIKVEKGEILGRDVLGEMAIRVRKFIEDSKLRLEKLQNTQSEDL
ncbi:MAG: DnaJ domain-containing protein [Armatimonadota bacterium]